MAVTAPMITVQRVESGGPGTLRPRETLFVAHGQDGHVWMLARLSPEAAARDGLAYFLATRTLCDGRWVLS